MFRCVFFISGLMTFYRVDLIFCSCDCDRINHRSDDCNLLSSQLSLRPSKDFYLWRFFSIEVSVWVEVTTECFWCFPRKALVGSFVYNDKCWQRSGCPMKSDEAVVKLWHDSARSSFIHLRPRRSIKGFAAKVRSDSGRRIDEGLKQICSQIFTAQDNRRLICILSTVELIPAHFGPRGVAVLDEGFDTDLDLDLESRLGVLDEAALLEVLVALLLLLGRVGRCVWGVAPAVVRVVTQHLVRTEEGEVRG